MIVPPFGEPEGNEVLYDFLLRVNGDGLAPGQLGEVDVMVAAPYPQVDTP